MILFFNEFKQYFFLDNLQPEEKFTRLLDISKKIKYHYEHLKSSVHCHYLFSTFMLDKNPLEYLYQRFKKLDRIIYYDIELSYLLEYIKKIIIFTNTKKTGRLYCIYSYTKILLEEAEKFCYKWTEYLDSIPISLDTKKYYKNNEKDRLLTQKIKDKTIFKQFCENSFKGWKSDCIYNKIGRFLAQDNSFNFGSLEKDAIEQLINHFYNYHGLIIHKNILEKNKVMKNIYCILKKQSKNFTDIPGDLEDLKRIAVSKLAQINPKILRDKFSSIIPNEVQSPNFSRSVLVEFLQYQMVLCNDPEVKGGRVRKKILLMQLSGEYEELQNKYKEAQKEYSRYLIDAQNLALLNKNDQTELLLKEVKNKWIQKLKIFADYLDTTKFILDQEREHKWRWEELLGNEENTFIYCLYPDLKDHTLRMIYLKLFSLIPLPKAKDIEDIVEKCKHFNLTKEKIDILITMLAQNDENCKDTLDKVKNYIDVNCLSYP